LAAQASRAGAVGAMAVTPMLLAVGAGAAAGSAFLVMQEQQRLQRVAAMREMDKREQDMLLRSGNSISSISNGRIAQRLQDAPPVWVLMVRLGEAQLSDKLLGKKLKVIVKYGDRGWSLKRETKEVLCTKGTDGQGPVAAFNENCIFLLRQGIALRVRLRLVREGRTRRHVLAMQDFMLNIGSSPIWHEATWKIVGKGTASRQRLGSIRLGLEVRNFSIDELCSHGINVGQVVQRVRLADVTGRREMPLLQGQAIQASPEALVAEQRRAEEGRQAEERLQTLQEEAPGAESDSEAEDEVVVAGAESGTGDSSSEGSSEAESSSEEGRRSHSPCPHLLHCGR